MKYCGQCGMELKDDAKFCAKCGAKCPECAMKNHTGSNKPKGERKTQRSPMIGITIILIVIAVGVFAMCWYSSVKQQIGHAADSGKYIPAPTDMPTEEAETSEMDLESKSVVNSIGKYSIDDIKSGGYGFYIMYDDGSFDRYYSGNVLIWEGPRPMTYGADYIPQDFIIDIARDKVNRERISAGKLVLVCNEINRVEYSLTPVEFSGNAMSCIVENEEIVLFLTQNSVEQWNSGSSIGWVIADTIKVNGVFLNEWSANMESSNRRGYLPLTESDEFQIAVTRGAKMETVDCVVDKRYYFQDLETEFDLKLEPTTDGYAIVDLSDIPVGEYLIHYSYWNSERGARSVLATHVVVE